MPGYLRSMRVPNLLLAVFVITRLLVGVAAVTSTGVYDKVDTDVSLYQSYGYQIVQGGQAPYAEISIEYPPVVLPFLAAPALAPDAGYGVLWVLLMVLVDGVGLLAVLRLDRRWGGVAAWWWVALVPLLGPLAYTRFDLLPAVATVWALERAAAGRWGSTGGWLAAGTLAKLWPALLVPATLAIARRPGRVVLGGSLVTAAVLLPFAPVWGQLAQDVLGYHAARGIQVESLWGNGLQVAAAGGYPVEVVREFGADHLHAPVAPALEILSMVLSLGAVALSAWWARSRIPRDDAAGLTALAFTVLVVTVVTGSVLSPQYLIWVVALGAATQADPASPLRVPVVLLALAAGVNHVLFPTLYVPLVQGEPLGLAVLTVRNLLLLAIATTAVAGLWRASRRDRGGGPPSSQVAGAPAAPTRR